MKTDMNLAWIALRILVLAAPFVLHLGTAGGGPIWGGSTIPDWTVWGSVAAALAATALGVYDLKLLRARWNKRIWPGCIAATVVLTPFAALLLYYVVDLLAAVLAIPYALVTVCTVAHAHWRWRTGPRRIGAREGSEDV